MIDQENLNKIKVEIPFFDELIINYTSQPIDGFIFNFQDDDPIIKFILKESVENDQINSICDYIDHSFYQIIDQYLKYNIIHFILQGGNKFNKPKEEEIWVPILG